MHLSCRSDRKLDSMSVNELADDFEQRLSFKDRLVFKDRVVGADVRPGLHNLKQVNSSQLMFNNPDYEYIDIYPPYIIKKSEDVSLPINSDCLEPNAYYNYIGGLKRTKHKKKHKKSKKQKKSKKLNKTKKRRI